jgi:hypothetical protein
LEPEAIRKYFVKLLIGFKLNRKASPGMPLMLINQTNEGVIDQMGMKLVYLCEARLKLLMYTDPLELRTLSPLQLVELYLVDAVRTFVKQEPHSNEKIVQRRMRLISSRGLVDQMVERFLFGDYQDWCISKWSKIPPKPGMGHTDAMMASVWDEIQVELMESGRARNNDVSGWDLSVFPDLMDHATEVPILIMDPPKLIANAMRNITYCLYVTLWITSDGVILVQVHKGVMKSGSFRTASFNSDMRVLMSYCITLECGGTEEDCFAISMGDDCVEDGTGEFEVRKAAYAKYGIRLTDCIELKLGEPFEFTSHMYRHPGVASLHTWPKTLYRLLMKDFDATEFMQFCYECRHNDELPEIIKFLVRVGWLNPDMVRFTTPQALLDDRKRCPKISKGDNLTDSHYHDVIYWERILFVWFNFVYCAITMTALLYYETLMPIIRGILGIIWRGGCMRMEWYWFDAVTICIGRASPVVGVLLTPYRFSTMGIGACGLSWGPQIILRKTRNCFDSATFIMKKQEEKKKVAKEVAKEVRKMLPASASSTGKQKAKVISKPKGVVGSVKEYATPYNALNSQLHKFLPSETQAALMAWSHTVANPRTLNPHPVPLIAASGASASVPQMYRCTLYGTAVANAAGCLFIGAIADAWKADDTVMIPTPSVGGRRLCAGGWAGQGAPVCYTVGTYVGTGGAAPATASQYPNAAATEADNNAGLIWCDFPSDFIPVVSAQVRYTNVAVELRARPVAAALNASGELTAFNYRRTPNNNVVPNQRETGDMLTIENDYLSRQRVSCPNWPSTKWLSAVAIPNTYTCFGQWTPLGTLTDNDITVGSPQVFIMGEGLAEGSPVEFEATYVYAIYGAKTYMSSSGVSSGVSVDGSRASPVIANGFIKTLAPAVMGANKVHPGGVAAVVKAEQQDGRMPSTQSVISGIKAGKEVFEAVTGTDIGEEIAGVIAEIGAMLL